MSFLIDGHTFDLSDNGPVANSSVFFQSGNPISVVYNGQDGNILISLLTGALSYVYADQTPGVGRSSQGTIVATLAPPPSGVPEPSTLGLIGLGLLGLGAMVRRRKNAHMLAAA
jgi:hypothetical protein